VSQVVPIAPLAAFNTDLSFIGVGYDHDVRSVVYGGTAICFEEGVRNGSLVSIAK